MATYTFYMPTIEGTVGGLIPDDISLPTLMSGDVLDLATKTITFANASRKILTDEEVKSYYKHRKVIELGGLDGARNTWELKEDGSAIYTQNALKKILNGSENWVYQSGGSSTTHNLFQLLATEFAPAYGSNLGICDKLNWGMFWATTRNVISVDGSKTLGISIDKTIASDLTMFKAWLSTNNVTFIGKLSTPIITTIPKELVPTILTQLQNQVIFGEGVSPFSATIKLPTTDDIAKSYPVTLLNSWTQTPSTAIPVVNLINTGIVRLQMDLTAPTTGMNATLFSLPLEIRPITNSRIPVFVNGVSQLATIDKTTGNVNLASVPSASANIYIKTDYRRDI